MQYMGGKLSEPAAVMMNRGEDIADFYSKLMLDSAADTFPEKFDHRDRGFVNQVKNQRPWGTCWSQRWAPVRRVF